MKLLQNLFNLIFLTNGPHLQNLNVLFPSNNENELHIIEKLQKLTVSPHPSLCFDPEQSKTY